MFRILILLLAPYTLAQVYHQPEQVHLAFGENTNEITVTWSTLSFTKQSVVEYGTDGLNLRAEGTFKKFVETDRSRTPLICLICTSQYIHKVTLKNLTYSTKYVYHCGGDKGWSERFWFKIPPPNDEWQPYLAVFGDLGNRNPRSLPRLQQETQKEMYDAIFHLGDFAYDLNTNNGRMGDQFMRQIQSVAAYLPYMTCVGNHESAYNFSHYKARFNMPGDTESLWYSINLGPMHVIFLSTEVYYFYNYFGMSPYINQYQWLEQDLIKATLPENRAKQPWIVVTGLRPMYCSDDDNDDCLYPHTRTRVGIPDKQMQGLEKLFFDYGVDLEFWAHEHSYERLWPVYDMKVFNGSLNEPYRNPKAPVHIISGSAGCREYTDPFIKNPHEWSAFRSSDYGYARMKVCNSSHLYIEQTSDDKNGQVIDSVWIIKDSHGLYNNP